MQGCALVEFASSADAANAIATLNDTELLGRAIFVREVCTVSGRCYLHVHAYVHVQVGGRCCCCCCLVVVVVVVVVVVLVLVVILVCAVQCAGP
jgi:hypothetical protein